jgi:fatty-acyl-CoA synthase
MPDLHSLARLPRRALTELDAVRQLAKAGIIRPESPVHLAAKALALRQFGPVGGGLAGAAISYPDRTGLVDERGSLSYTELDQRSTALANAWRDRGIAEGARVGILCRNHRGAVDITMACAKVGARALFLNTDFSGPQATDVCAREGVEALAYDEEFSFTLDGIPAPLGRYLAWTDSGAAPDGTELVDDLAGSGTARLVRPPSRHGSLVLLTSGTTGTPKGAPRPQPRGLSLPGGVLSKIPFRSGGSIYVAPPMFHAWGLFTSVVALATGATMVTRRRFDPKVFLDDLETHRVAAAVVVPVMLKRVLALGDDAIESRRFPELRIIASSGAQLEAAVATRVLDLFGEVLYNLYGSTECAYATIATPEDLRAAPGCAGRAPFGTVVKILDPAGRPLPAGRTGRIFIDSPAKFGGYTGGGDKERIGDLMSSGDVGHLDEAGRLWVEGRDDDMIVSGGENVFPQEVEELLTGHPDIADVAVIGVDDEEFGKALRAFVVRAAGAALSEDDVRQYVKDNLARFKVPRSAVFLDELPRNPTGKVLKRKLAEL